MSVLCRRFTSAVMAVALSLSMTGCHSGQPAAREVSQTQRMERVAAPRFKQSPRTKPAKSTKDSKERHPSQWNRKLRAKFA